MTAVETTDLPAQQAPASDLLATPRPDAAAEQAAERILAAALGTMELLAVHLGDRLGWYRTLAEHGPLTSVELARLSGTAERYAREWLEHQAASGYLDVADPDAEPCDRLYRLHAGVAEATTDPDSPAYLAPLARFLVASGRAIDRLAEAYRTGGGVSWAELGDDARFAQGALNRPLLLHELPTVLVPQLPELHARLTAGARRARPP